MAIAVDVAKDPKAIKSKFIGNFTKRQVICFGAAAVVGVPFYLLTRKVIGTDVAALMMVAVMLPFFFIAMYEERLDRKQNKWKVAGYGKADGKSKDDN